MTAVGAPGDLRLTLPADRSAQRTARAAIRERWPQLDEQVTGDLMLVVSELVSNAVRHGQPDIVLWVRADPFAVDVSVFDHGPDVPPTELREVDMWNAESGRGLHIIDRLADRWGVDASPGDGGKAVWATLTPSPGRPG